MKKEESEFEQLVNPVTKKWYLKDQWGRLWVQSDDMSLRLCITIDQHLNDDGMYREMKRELQMQRKDKGFQPNELATFTAELNGSYSEILPRVKEKLLAETNVQDVIVSLDKK